MFYNQGNTLDTTNELALGHVMPIITMSCLFNILAVEPYSLALHWFFKILFS
jgi:hypothetical protein